jgi:predicted metal-dependent peptidase
MLNLPPTPSEDTDFNLQELGRLLDITKSQVFMNRQAAFFGPLMSYLHFIWSEDVPTAATDGRIFWWNPRFFLKLDPLVRKTILMHELWHNARLHMVRCNGRHPKVWNYACDIRINNDLENEGYSFAGVHPWLDHSFDASGEPMPEEQIYDELMAMAQTKLDELLASLGDSWSGEPPTDDDLVGDMMGGGNPTKEDMADQVANVVAATHQAKMNNAAGDIPGSVVRTLKQFLTPIIPWETQLHKFFFDLIEEDYSWARPNRRMLDIVYLPSREEDEGRLDHLIYYLDVSGSVTDAQVIRFNSEVKYIWDVLKPKKLTLVQFDTQIQDTKIFNDGDEFEELVVIGRGGTCLKCVREHMIEHRPTAAIIFTDLGCEPMEPIPMEVPTIWVAIQNRTTPIPFGTRINIQ